MDIILVVALCIVLAALAVLLWWKKRPTDVIARQEAKIGTKFMVVRQSKAGEWSVGYAGGSGAKARDIFVQLQDDRETLVLAFLDHGTLRTEWSPRRGREGRSWRG